MNSRLAISIQEMDGGLAFNSTVKTLAQGSVGMSQKVQRILEMIRKSIGNIPGNVINRCSDRLKSMNSFGSPEM